MSIRKKKHDGIFKIGDQRWKVRWREGGRNRSLTIHGSHELAKKIKRKKLSLRDENRHLEVKREVNFPVKALIERYQEEYGQKKKSWDRERSVLEGFGTELGRMFVRELEDGSAIDRWYKNLTAKHRLSAGTAVRHFNVVHHMWERRPRSGRRKPELIEIRRIRLR